MSETNEKGNFKGISLLKPQSMALSRIESIIIKELKPLERIFYQATGFVSEDLNVSGLGIFDEDLSNIKDILMLFPELQHLCLSKCGLKTFPEGIAKMGGLKTLYLPYNMIEKVPSIIEDNQKLMHLNLAKNKISNQLLELDFSKLSALQDVHLSYNPINHFPLTLLKSSTIKSLSLSHCGLMELPENLGTLRKMEDFRIDMNSISTIPESLQQMTALRTLDLSKNKIQHLPSFLKKLERLEKVTLYHNPIIEAPEVLSELYSLCDLTLDQEQYEQYSTLFDNIKAKGCHVLVVSPFKKTAK